MKRILLPLVLVLAAACKRGSGDASDAGSVTPAQSAIRITSPFGMQSGAEVDSVAMVDLREDGTMWFNGVAMADETALRTAARAAVASTPNLRAEIVAQPNVVFSRVVTVMDTLKQAGIRDLWIGKSASLPAP